MTGYEVNRLAQYNSEVARGLIHTEKHTERMRELQRRFDAGEWHQPQPRAWWQRLLGL